MVIRIMTVCLLFAAGTWSGGTAMAQDAESGPEAAEEAAATEEEEDLAQIVGADEEGRSGEYEQEEDDDFVPTQEVSSDQSVNFPVDI